MEEDMCIFPAYEVAWLQGIPHKYRTYVGALSYIYPVDLLPPTISKYVKSKSIHTQYINISPVSDTREIMKWQILGWLSKPKYGGNSNADWYGTFLTSKMA
jgi:hypothetical protein